MSTASLVPVSLTDTDANVTSGGFADVDNTIAIPSGVAIICNNNGWTNQSDGTENGSINLGITNAPGDYSSFTSIKFEIRARVTGGVADDTMTWRARISGTNAPSSSVSWVETDDGSGYVAKTFTDSVVSPSKADIDGWIVKLWQDQHNQEKGGDNLQFEADEVECILTYVASVGGANPKGPLGMVLQGALGGPIG